MANIFKGCVSRCSERKISLNERVRSALSVKNSTSLFDSSFLVRRLPPFFPFPIMKIYCVACTWVFGAHALLISVSRMYFLLQINKIFLTLPRPPPYFLLKQEKHNNIEQQKNNGSNNIVVDETIFHDFI